MTNKEQILMRYICEGDMIGARKYTKAILEGNTAKKDEYFRETMLQKLARTNFLELPENLKNILVAEDSALFPEKKFLVREAEEAIAKKVLSIYRVAGKLSPLCASIDPAWGERLRKDGTGPVYRLPGKAALYLCAVFRSGELLSGRHTGEYRKGI